MVVNRWDSTEVGKRDRLGEHGLATGEGEENASKVIVLLGSHEPYDVG